MAPVAYDQVQQYVDSLRSLQVSELLGETRLTQALGWTTFYLHGEETEQDPLQ